MKRAPFQLRVAHRSDIIELAKILAESMGPFQPKIIVYLQHGGTLPGVTVAQALGIPSTGLDVSYPLGRALNRTPRALHPFIWPLKETLYRIRKPTMRDLSISLGKHARIGLVDDTASTGRTLSIALDFLISNGIERQQIEVGVLRCGRRARNLVDHFVETKPLVVVHNNG